MRRKPLGVILIGTVLCIVTLLPGQSKAEPFFASPLFTQKSTQRAYFYGKGQMGMTSSMIQDISEYWEDYHYQNYDLDSFQYPSFVVNGLMGFESPLWGLKMEYIYRQYKKTYAKNREEREQKSAFRLSWKREQLIYHKLRWGYAFSMHHIAQDSATGDKSVILDQTSRITSYLGSQEPDIQQLGGITGQTGLSYTWSILTFEFNAGASYNKREIKDESITKFVGGARLKLPLQGILFFVPFYTKIYTFYRQNFFETNFGVGAHINVTNNTDLHSQWSDKRLFAEIGYELMPFWRVYSQFIHNKRFEENILTFGMNIRFSGIGFPYPLSQEPAATNSPKASM